jgi:inner membrane protein
MEIMVTLITFLTTLGPQHWLVLGLVLLIAEMASGTTYLLWPAVAAFITALATMAGLDGWFAELALFAGLVIVLTAFGRPLVERWRRQGEASSLNERAANMVGVRGVLTAFANGAGSVKVNDTVWRVVSDEALHAGQAVIVESIDGVTLRVRAAAS